MKTRNQPLSALKSPFFALSLLWAGIAVSGCAPSENSTDAATEEHREEETVIRLTAAELNEFEIEVRTAGPGTLIIEKTFPGEVRPNQDRYAHVVPRVSGVVRSVFKSVGDQVRTGETMAVLESRELADVKANYLAGLERRALAVAAFEREQRLFEKKISSEQEFLQARQALAETRIVLRSDRQKLRALGFSDQDIEELPSLEDGSLIEYPLPAPFNGTVLEKHIVQGEALEADAAAFDVADLSTVWVDLSIYQSDLALVREGQEVSISAGFDLPDARGTISYVRPIVGEETRTAIARIVLPNPDGLWRPGMFVTGAIGISEVDVAVLAPLTAVQQLEGQDIVFVRTPEGLEPRAIRTGRRSETEVEITSGVASGDEYVASGGFVLKSQLQKSELADEH
jgi:membrane fusion protein, heavy metal efflux system